MTEPIGTPGEWTVLLGSLLGLLLAESVFTRLTGRGPSLGYDVFASAAWTLAALVFGGWVVLHFGSAASLAYFTAYLVERSLSFDNLFVFIVLFETLAVPEDQRPRLLRWGVFGAVLARGVLIGLGVSLIARLRWLLPLLGVLLVVTGVRLAMRRGPSTSLARSAWLSRLRNARPSVRWLSPWLVALLVVELCDLIFAADSLPAVFGITRSPFIAFSSNAFAVVGLRSLFGLAAAAMKRLQLLHHGVGLILVFVGGTMLVGPWWHPPEILTLSVVLGILAVTLAASLRPGLVHPAGTDGVAAALRDDGGDR